MAEQPRSRAVSLKVVSTPGAPVGVPSADSDPFAEVEA